MPAWISYAQNAEDVRLRRTFAGQSKGFYIDVGANHPVELSVTKHFYESGWSGVNVEPLPKQFALIQKDRPRDINLNVGCSDHEGVLKLFAARKQASGLSSFTSEEVSVHRQQGIEFDEISTPVLTLSSICERHVGERSIDFLSVDVEGHERQVLAGADFSRFRPRVVLVEATRPNSTEPTHDRWEHLILNHGYVFAVFDGLNRYYVRREDERLIPSLALAPNVFDDFVPNIYKRQIDELKAQVVVSRLVSGVARPIAGISRAVTLLKHRVRLRRGAGRG